MCSSKTNRKNESRSISPTQKKLSLLCFIKAPPFTLIPTPLPPFFLLANQNKKKNLDINCVRSIPIVFSNILCTTAYLYITRDFLRHIFLACGFPGTFITRTLYVWQTPLERERRFAKLKASRREVRWRYTLFSLSFAGGLIGRALGDRKRYAKRTRGRGDEEDKTGGGEARRSRKIVRGNRFPPGHESFPPARKDAKRPTTMSCKMRTRLMINGRLTNGPGHYGWKDRVETLYARLLFLSVFSSSDDIIFVFFRFSRRRPPPPTLPWVSTAIHNHKHCTQRKLYFDKYNLIYFVQGGMQRNANFFKKRYRLLCLFRKNVWNIRRDSGYFNLVYWTIQILLNEWYSIL